MVEQFSSNSSLKHNDYSRLTVMNIGDIHVY